MRYKNIAAAAAAGALILAGLVGGASAAQAAGDVATTTTLTASTTTILLGATGRANGETVGLAAVVRDARNGAIVTTPGVTYQVLGGGATLSGGTAAFNGTTCQATFRAVYGGGGRASTADPNFDVYAGSTSNTVTVRIVGGQDCGAADPTTDPTAPPIVDPTTDPTAPPVDDPTTDPTTPVSTPTVTATGAPACSLCSPCGAPCGHCNTGCVTTPGYSRSPVPAVYVTQPLTAVYVPASGTGSPSFTG
jgi:hypothetical protein